MNARFRAFGAGLALLVVLGPLAASAGSAPTRAWEMNGIRLEPEQVERLADEMAARTVAAVVAKVEGIELEAQQTDAMHGIYREVSLDVFDDVVQLVKRPDLSDTQKEEAVRARVLAGQRASHERLIEVLSEKQLLLYTRWEAQQVDAFTSRRWERRRRRRR